MTVSRAADGLVLAPEPNGWERTPIHVLRVLCEGLEHTLYLKDERVNATGSIKDRTARALVSATTDRLGGAVGLVESTSGNLGAALAFEAQRVGVTFLAVTDPNLSPDLAEKIRSFGASIEVVRDPDSAGNYLSARLQRVGERAASGDWIWTNQYASDCALRVHHDGTGPELVAQLPEGFDEVLVAASTCGTLAGLGRLLRVATPAARVVAVDVEGSSVFGGIPGRRLITGIGSTRRPDFDLTNSYDTVEVVSESAAIGACFWLLRTTGIGVGASTGAVVAACLRRFARSTCPVRAVAFIADGSENYRRTIFDECWLRRNGFAPEWPGAAETSRKPTDDLQASVELTLR